MLNSVDCSPFVYQPLSMAALPLHESLNLEISFAVPTAFRTRVRKCDHTSGQRSRCQSGLCYHIVSLSHAGRCPPRASCRSSPLEYVFNCVKQLAGRSCDRPSTCSSSTRARSVPRGQELCWHSHTHIQPFQRESALQMADFQMAKRPK